MGALPIPTIFYFFNFIFGDESVAEGNATFASPPYRRYKLGSLRSRKAFAHHFDVYVPEPTNIYTSKGFVVTGPDKTT